MRDTRDPGTDADVGTPGYQTDLPIVDLGSRSGRLELPGQRRSRTTTRCRNLASATAPSPRAGSSKTASTSWTPLAAGNLTNPPFPSEQQGMSKDAPTLNPGSAYCVQRPGAQRAAELFRARSGATARSSTTAPVPRSRSPATRAAAPAPRAATRTTSARTTICSRFEARPPAANPLFIWNPIARQAVVLGDRREGSVLHDTSIDYALHPHSRRTRSGRRAQPLTYPDETTSYYWVVLPATGTTGGGARRQRPARGA